MKIVNVKIFDGFGLMFSVSYSEINIVHIDEYLIDGMGNKFLLVCGEIEV